MNYKLIRIKKAMFFLPVFSLLYISCGQTSDTSKNKKSDLINKIQAVHNQMAKQGNISEEEQLALKSFASLVGADENYSSQEDMKDAIPYDKVEFTPIYPGCDGLSQEESKQCFTESFNSLIASEFNPDIPNNLGIEKPQRVEVFFMVNKDGTLSHHKVREPNVVILAEIVRVLKLMPKLKPGVQNGEKVNVMCSVIVHYGD